ncbi:MAG: YfcE family phosphodiesterase [Oscillospiraceae bacterium]|nr:YfcE family phosphodiesterase [Oscillospiraceae bacterium]
MIKICVFSDSHGSPEGMITALEKEKPALYFFLGDGERDLERVRERFPDLPYYAVRGNCDLRSALSGSLCCTVGGVGIFAAHGHLYDVKYEPELESLAAAAREAGACLALFGHTHRACLESRRGITFLNPGTIGRTAHPGYAVLYAEGGRFTAELRRL